MTTLDTSAGLPASRRLFAVGLMTLAMLVVPFSDGFAKMLMADHHPLFVAWARYLGGSLCILPVLLRQRTPLRLAPSQYGFQVLRAALLILAMSFYFIAIRTVPLADALSVYFIAPMIAVVLARILLGEPLARIQLVSVGLGFVGALIVLRPGASMNPDMLWSLASGLAMGGYFVASRHASQGSPPLTTLAFQYACGTLLLTPGALLTWSAPDSHGLVLILAMGLVSACSHMMSITAFRFASTSTLAPLVYLELLSNTLFGLVVFGDFPGSLAWAGIALIVGAGLLQLRRPANTSPA